MKRKMLIILLSALLTVSAFVPMTGASAIGFEPGAQRVIDFVKAFSFMNDLSVEDMQNGTALTRAQLATIVSRIMLGGEDRVADGEVPFTDVPEWARPQVYFVYQQGIMVGDGEGRFMPDEYVTYGQAAKVFIHLLGYDTQAILRGGYPVGYIQTGNRLGLLDGIDVKADSAISRFDVAKILYQAVGVDVQNVYAINSEYAEYRADGRDYLGVYLGITSAEGVLGSINGKSAVKDVKSVKGKAAFGKTVAKVADARYDSLLGSNVRYFLKEVNGQYELMYLEEQKGNVVTRVKACDVLKNDTEFSVTTFVYDDGDDKPERVQLVNGFCYAYNGVYDFDFDWRTYPFDTGYVDLIDHDDDEVIDVVMVWNFEELVVDKVSDTFINSKHRSRLDLSPYHDNVSITFPDGSMGSMERLTDIKMWDILSIAKSRDGKSISLIVCRDGVSGVVERKDTTNANTFIINGREYVTSKHFNDCVTKGYTDDIKLGQSSEFYFNIVGEIAGIREKKSDTELQYGFLMAVNPSKGLGGQVGLLILETSGKQSTFYTEDKIWFTAKSGLRAKMNADTAILGDDLHTSGRFEPQVIRYFVNKEGKVSEVECAVSAGPTMFELDSFSKDYEGGNETFWFNDHSSGFCSYDDDGTILYPEFWPSTTGTIFYIPVMDGSIVKSDAKVITTNYFKNGGTYKNMTFYDNDETMVADVIVYQPNVAEVSETFKESDVFVLVDEVVSAVNAEGEVVNMLDCYSGGSHQRKEMVNQNNVQLNYGDIIYAKYNSDGELYVDESSVIFKNKTNQPLYFKINHEGGNPFSECWSTNGILYRKGDNHVTVYCGAEGFRSISLGRNTPLVYIIGEKGNVRLGSPEDLVSSSAVLKLDGTISGDLDGSRVFLNTRIDYVKEIFIFED